MQVAKGSLFKKLSVILLSKTDHSEFIGKNKA